MLTPCRRALLMGALFLAPLVATAPLAGQVADSARVAELERRLDALSRELERLDLGDDVVAADTSVFGLGLGASKVYRVDSGVSIGGYGEILYENFAAEDEGGAPASASDRFDALRAILYVGYKFNDRLLFNSEIEIEHGDEAFLEFAYVDYLLTPQVGLRAGVLLAPLGLTNELHEPTLYLGTERPVTENRIIPTTWRENGFGLFGGNEDFSWRAYLMNSFDASGFGAAGLRGGRQKASKALSEDFGLAARIDYTGTPGLLVGASAYRGGTAQGRELEGAEVDGAVTIWDLHVDFERRGFEFRGLIAGAQVDEAAELSALNGLTGAAGIGESMLGWYVEAGYDVLRSVPTEHRLVPYARFEQVDTHREVPAGFDVDPARDLRVVSLGAAWFPETRVVFKAGYQLQSNPADSGLDQWNIQIGWLF